MDHVPSELIEKILSCSSLSIKDVINFSSTCQRFRNSVLSSSVIWKQKFHDNYPKFTDLFHNTQTNFFEEIRYIYGLKKRTVALLETMPSRFYIKYLLSEEDLEEWDKLMNERKETYYCLISILTEIIKVNEPIESMEIVPLDTPGNKTLQYYARKALIFIRQQHLTRIWENFRCLPPKKQLLEKAAVFVALWCQPDTDLSDKDIDNDLDKIATLVKQRLFEINPKHQIFKATHLDKLKEENLDGNLWSLVEGRQVMGALREVLYIHLEYCGARRNRDNYYQSDNSLINKVLEYKTGLPIILAIIYESVGRRLGLFLEPIILPDNVLLRFTESEGSKRSVFYIDTLNNGAIIEKAVCPNRRSRSRRVLVRREEVFPVASTLQVVERIVSNLELLTRRHDLEPNERDTFIRSVLELQLLVNSLSSEVMKSVVTLARFYSLHKVNTKKLEPYTKPPSLGIPLDNLVPPIVEETTALIKNTTRESDDLNIQTESFQVQRTDDMKYAVGMILKDWCRNEQCVIYDWVCEYAGSCPTLLTLKKRRKQAYYKVLVEDGSSRELAEEDLLPCSDVGRLLTHKELGRYFSHFFVNHFVPNAEKEREYPWDKEVRHKYYYDQQLS